MSFLNDFPHVRQYDGDLGWLIRMVQLLGDQLTDFVNINTIKYADPISWDITTQYEANTVVVDPQTGNAYISTRPVPSGVSISNTDYWTQIYNYADTINDLQEQIAAANEEANTTASAYRATGTLVWLNGELYRVTQDMQPGYTYVVGSNIDKVTIEDVMPEIVKEQLLAGLDAVLNDLDVTGDETVGGDLSVTGDETVGGDLSVTGDGNVGGDLSVTGDGNVGGDLTVSGQLKTGTPVSLNASFQKMHGETAGGTPYDFIIAGSYPEPDITFDSVSDLVAADVIASTPVSTRGYYSAGDGGGALYMITASATANAMDIIALNNGLFAVMLDRDGDIRKYGAQSGSDVSAHILRAATAVSRAFIPGGTYSLGSAVTLPSGCEVCGTSLRESILTVSGSDSYGFVLSNFDINLHDFGIIHNGTPTSGTQIDISTTNCMINRVFLYNGYCAIQCSNHGTTNFMEELVIEQFHLCGIRFLNTSDISVQSSIIKSTKSGSRGVEMVNLVQAIKFVDVSFLLMENAIMLSSSDASDPALAARYNMFTNCYFDSCKNFRSANMQFFTFVGCWFSNRPNAGISIVGTETQGNMFQNCIFKNCQTYGLYLENAKDTIVSGCVFADNGRGLMITGTCIGAVISGNTFYNSVHPDSAGFSQDFGIFINGSTSDRFTITGNVAHDNSNSGYTSGVSASSTFIVNDNVW